VLVADPKIATAVVRSKRRVFIIGAQVGQTNMYFFDADGRQIGGLDIAVTNDPRPLNVLADPVVVSNVIVVYRGMISTTYSCTPSCNPQGVAPPETPTPVIHTVNENININKMRSSRPERRANISSGIKTSVRSSGTAIGRRSPKAFQIFVACDAG
jgi:Pilus formation protein N terminal region